MNKEAISVVLKFLKFYILLGAFFNHGICQDCELQYVMELPSNISCNPYLEMELKLKCVVQGMASIGRRVEMAWFHTSIDNITLDVTNISSLGRHFMHRAVTHGDKWNLTSYLNLTGIRYPAQAGKWFCQPTLDGNLVLPSNMLTIGEPEGNTTCNESLAHSTTRCAYFLSPSTTDPMLVNITDSQPQPQTISSFMLSLPSSPIPNPTTSSTKSVGLWVFALAIIVVVFAIIILVLAVLLVVFFLKRKKKLKVINVPTCNLSTNSAYGVANPAPIDTEDTEEPMYAVIPAGEACYVIPNEIPPTPPNMNPPIEKHPENDYVTQPVYLEVKA